MNRLTKWNRKLQIFREKLITSKIKSPQRKVLIRNFVLKLINNYKRRKSNQLMSLENRSIYQLRKESNIKNLGNHKILLQQIMNNLKEWLQLLELNQDMLLPFVLLNNNSQDMVLQLLLNKNTCPLLQLKLNLMLDHTWARRNYSPTLPNMRNMPRDRNQIYYF